MKDICNQIVEQEPPEFRAQLLCLRCRESTDMTHYAETYEKFINLFNAFAKLHTLKNCNNTEMKRPCQ